MANEPLIDVEKLKRVVSQRAGRGKEFSGRGLSLVASGGKNPDMVRDLINRGQDKKVSYETVVGIAGALGLDPGEFLLAGNPVAGVERINVIGQVQGGVWREQAQWPEEEWYPIEVEPSPVPGAERFALEMVGYSMEDVIPNGSTLECLRVFDNADLQPIDGDIVIVERKKGDLVETTCKRLRIFPNGVVELHAESSRPEFATPLRIDGIFSEGETDDETRIVAIVDKATQRFFRARRPPKSARG